jgi:hypothetical protein
MFITCLYTKLHIPAFSGPLVIAVILKANENVGMANMLFYILQKYKSCIFLKIWYHASFKICSN